MGKAMRIVLLALIAVAAVWLLVATMGCGQLAPFTDITPPQTQAQSVHNVVKGGADKSVTNTTKFLLPEKVTSKPVPVVVEGKKMSLPPATSVVIEKTETSATHDSTDLTTGQAASKGSGIVTDKDVPATFNSGAPGDLNVGKGVGTEGVTAATFKGAVTSTGSAWVFIIGGLMVAGGVICATYFSIPSGWYLAGAGGALIVLGFLIPAYGGWVMLAAIVGGVAWGVYYLWQHKAIVTNIVAGVQSGINTLSADAKAVFKAATATTMDSSTKDVVAQVKLDEGIVSTPAPVVTTAPVATPATTVTTTTTTPTA